MSNDPRDPGWHPPTPQTHPRPAYVRPANTPPATLPPAPGPGPGPGRWTPTSQAHQDFAEDYQRYLTSRQPQPDQFTQDLGAAIRAQLEEDARRAVAPGMRAVFGDRPGATSGGGGGGGYGGGGGGGAAAPAVDPLAELETMLKTRMQDQIKTIRETYKPLFKNLRKDRKQSRREIRTSGRNARQGVAAEQAQMQERFDAANTAAAEATMPEGIDAESAAEIAAARAIFGESRAARQENANVGMDRIQAMSRGIQQAGLSTLQANSSDLISQLRAQRAQEIGARRQELNDAMFQLRAGQIAPAAAGGGGGGGGGGRSFGGGSSSSGGSPESLMILAQAFGADPRLLAAAAEHGLDDNMIGWIMDQQQGQFASSQAEQALFAQAQALIGLGYTDPQQVAETFGWEAGQAVAQVQYGNAQQQAAGGSQLWQDAAQVAQRPVQQGQTVADAWWWS